MPTKLASLDRAEAAGYRGCAGSRGQATSLVSTCFREVGGAGKRDQTGHEDMLGDLTANITGVVAVNYVEEK